MADEGKGARTPRWRASSRRELPLRAAFLCPWALLLIAGGAASEARELPAPASPAWRPLVFPSIERTTRYEPDAGAAPGAVRADSECSASGLVLALSDVDLERTPILRWRWRAATLPAGPDERSRQGDDFAARVSVMFPLDPARASLFERARRQVERALLGGEEPPRRAITFVWTRAVEPGAVWDNPFDGRAKMVALTRGPLAPEAGWREQAVDLAARFRALFGHAPPAPMAIGIMSDSDNSCSRALAWFADFQLAARAP